MRPREAVSFAVLAALLVISLIMLFGCRTSGTFVEGTRFRMGVYIPWDGQLYGLQIVEYLNGSALHAPSNSQFGVSRQFASTNSYMGVVRTQDSSVTRVSVSR